ncbi:MAG: hypothetical protein A2W11_05565 [Ignavibacteria bacterium RBG_16_35_7]|nr:MAG: hypothetical protein A2W11_05565 [Ignavibacteria bacterium RBG_16_35_7]
MGQNYPNPFNATTIINYSVPFSSNVNIQVYDIIGQQVVLLVDEFKLAGNYSINFNAESLPSGVYFCSMQAGDFSANKKLIVLK